MKIKLTIFLLLCSALIGCSEISSLAVNSKENNNNPKVESARKSFDPATQRLISFSVSPTEQAVRYTKQMKITLSLKNEGDYSINGAIFKIKGDLYKYTDLTLSPNSKLDMNIIASDKIIYSEEIEPDQTVNIELLGEVIDAIDIDPKGYQYDFTPLETLDGREFVGDVDKKSAHVYILPKKDGTDQESTSISDAKKELAEYSPAMIDFNIESKTSAAIAGESVEILIKIMNKGTRPINGVSFSAGIDWQYITDRKIEPEGSVEAGFLDYIFDLPGIIKPKETATYKISGKIAEDISSFDELNFSLSPSRAVDGEKIIVLGEEKKKSIKLTVKK